MGVSVQLRRANESMSHILTYLLQKDCHAYVHRQTNRMTDRQIEVVKPESCGWWVVKTK